MIGGIFNAKDSTKRFLLWSCLSMFFKHNEDTKPSIIEPIGDSSQIIKIATNTTNDFYIL